MPLLKGMQVSVDIAGPVIKQLSDYGEYEAMLRLNLKNKYFPVFELGYGMAEHLNDEVTGISYETSAPYFRKKHRPHNKIPLKQTLEKAKFFKLL